MPGKISVALVGLLVLVRQAHAQEIIIAREERPHFPRAEVVAHPPSKVEMHVKKAVEAQATKTPRPEQKTPPEAAAIAQVPKQEQAISQPPKTGTPASQAVKVSTANGPALKPPVATTKPVDATMSKGQESPSQPPKADAPSNQTPKVSTASTPSPKKTLPVTKRSDVASKVSSSSAPPLKSEADRVQLKTTSATMPRPKRLTLVAGPAKENHNPAAVSVQSANNRFETGFTRLADGFDFPVGKPDAQGYYKARGFRSHGHLGEDWDGIRGGDTDLGDPIYSIGEGLVVFARDCHMGWGNVVIVRHSYRENGVVKNIDALYGHLDKMLVHRGQAVARGQEIATMGTAHGLYDAHLHLEIRKNIEIGMSRTAFARDFSNYYDPSQFILTHRHLSTSGGTYRVAMNTFVRDAHINFDRAKNYSHSHSRGGTSESAAALKKAIASKR